MMLEEKFKFGIIEKNLGFTKDKDVQGRVNSESLIIFLHCLDIRRGNSTSG